MKIYTKTGDRGKTSLFSGGRVSKSDLRIKAYGTIDELNSFVGLLVASEINISHKKILVNIQNKLYNIGSILAVKGKTSFKVPEIRMADVLYIEKEIDRLNLALPPIKNFIIPGGNNATALCHVCRSVCRRAERKVVELQNIENVDLVILKYLNRLSDYLFVLARKVSKETKANEIEWKQ